MAGQNGHRRANATGLGELSNREGDVRNVALVVVLMLAIASGLVWGVLGPTRRAALAALDCSIFSNQADAQAVLETGPLDPTSLDPDGDGIACEEAFPDAEAAADGATSAASPVPGGTPGATPAAASPTPIPTPTVALNELLPGAAEAPLGLVFERDEQRAVEDVAYQLAGQATDEAIRAQAADQLAAWGFDGAVVRYFRPDQTPLPEAPAQPPPPPPSGIRWLWVAAYRFADPASVDDAYDDLVAAALATDERLQPVDVVALGDETDAFISNDADGLFHVWLRTEFDIVWIAGTSSAGFPQADVEALARVVALRAAGEAPGTGLRIGGIAAPVSAANLRAEPSTAALIITTMPPGTLVVVTGPAVPNADEGRDWWPVEVIATGEVGWVAGELLAPTG